ncbi:MAG: SpoIIE family protein phosphatase [Anaerolineales bacterium]|nr:SpoIIE family protein phosphatase [Anaerolineales bacterium]
MPMLDIEKALRLQNARLSALHEVAMGLTSTLNLGDVLQRVAEMAQTLSDSAHAHIFLYDDARDELLLAASHWSTGQRSIPIQPRQGGITHLVARSGEPEFIDNTADHPSYAQMPSQIQPGALACLPLLNGKRVVGTLNLGYWEAHSFDDATRQFLDMMARQATLAIETARSHAEALKRAQLEHELQVAREFQASLMPGELPRVEGWDFGVLWQPAHTVSGDFYDFLNIENESLQGFLIADISDKGMPAALFTALARSTLRASITTACCPADWMTHANRVLWRDTVNGMFVTLCYAQIEPGCGEMIYVNAGHNPPLWFRRADQSFTPLTRTGIALGVDEERSFQQRVIRLEPGEFVLFYTDGVIEAANSHGEELGLDCLRRFLLDNQTASASGMMDALRKSLNTFMGIESQFDDMTALIVKRVE